MFNNKAQSVQSAAIIPFRKKNATKKVVLHIWVCLETTQNSQGHTLQAKRAVSGRWLSHSHNALLTTSWFLHFYMYGFLGPRPPRITHGRVVSSTRPRSLRHHLKMVAKTWLRPSQHCYDADMLLWPHAPWYKSATYLTSVDLHSLWQKAHDTI